MRNSLAIDSSANAVFTLVLIVLLLSSGIVFGQVQHPYQKYDDSPTQKDDREPRPGPEPSEPRPGAPEADTSLQETGFYQAGPRSGGFQGASGALGFGRGGITLPELRLKLPSIELPCLTRTRYAAKMRYEGGEAPWVSTGFRSVGDGVVAQRSGPREGDPREARGADGDKESSRGVDDCEEVRREYEQKIDKLNEKLEQCDKLEQELESALRKHQVGFNRVPATPSGVAGSSNDGLNRLPSHSSSASHSIEMPESMRLPPSSSSHRTPLVRTANYWNTEPQLLPEGVQMERLPLASSNGIAAQYPSTGY